MEKRPEIVLVVAVARNGVIGQNNGLPWHLPNDLKRFKRITLGKPVLMGRKTFESIGKPLPGRQNIVLTRDPDWHCDGVTVTPDLEQAIETAARDSHAQAEGIMVIGGGELFRKALPIATRIELTEVHAEPQGDVFMPPIDRTQWVEAAREEVAADTSPDGKIRPAHAFVTLVRRGATADGLAAQGAGR